MPIAMPRSGPPGNSWATSARLTANMIAPPTPCRPRARLRKVGSGGGGRARGGGGGEDRRARDEDAAAAEPVGERARGEDERGERQRVGVDDPLQVGAAAAEVLM